jgi:hypothetical protein
VKNSVKILLVAFLAVSVLGIAVAQATSTATPATNVDKSCCPNKAACCNPDGTCKDICKDICKDGCFKDGTCASKCCSMSTPNARAKCCAS